MQKPARRGGRATPPRSVEGEGPLSISIRASALPVGPNSHIFPCARPPPLGKLGRAVGLPSSSSVVSGVHCMTALFFSRNGLWLPSGFWCAAAVAGLLLAGDAAGAELTGAALKERAAEVNKKIAADYAHLEALYKHLHA